MEEEAAVGTTSGAPARNPGRRQSIKKTVASEVKAAKLSGDHTTACSNICKHFCGSVGVTVVLGLFLIIPIIMVYMGAKHHKKCPRERMIPIYILVFGVMLLFKGFITFIRRIVAHVRKEDDIPCEGHPLDGIMGIFLCCWFIAGNVWIIRAHNDFSDDKSSDQYCEKKMYDFAFWLNAMFYIVLWAAMIIGCCVRSILWCLCKCFCGKFSDDD